MLFKNEQKAVSNTTASNKGQELFGNWELSDELDDVDLSAVVGGVYADVGKVADVDANGKVGVHQNLVPQISIAAGY